MWRKRTVKRRWLIGIAILALVLSACGTSSSGSPDESTPASQAGSATAGGEVEVFSWWTAGGEADGLEAMLGVFSEEYPEYEFVNAAVAGGAGTEARAQLATRLAQNDPPSSWQGHAGQELIGTYVAAEKIQPLNDLYESEGWLDVMPEGLIDLISQDGNIYSVPVNIHRANVMWYIPDNLTEWGVEPPETWDEFLDVAADLEAQGVTPLAMGFQWTHMHLFESVLLGELGPDAYAALWDGSGDWGSDEVMAALETFAAVLEYENDDWSTLEWNDASQLVVDGDAAFQIMGDWAEGYFKSLDLEPGTGFGWAPAPGTGGSFQFLSDSFVLPVDAKNPDGALAWLKVAGSQAGQDAFNPIKGSIPARSDADRSLYDEYLTSAMDDWASDTVVGSLTHGVVANDAWKAEIDTALGLFLSDKDVDAFHTALADACAAEGPCS
jgi:glucose/mannose transport system substrate-binding protein